MRRHRAIGWLTRMACLGPECAGRDKPMNEPFCCLPRSRTRRSCNFHYRRHQQLPDHCCRLSSYSIVSTVSNSGSGSESYFRLNPKAALPLTSICTTCAVTVEGASHG
ncbi:hypothetical protein V8C34DRAFT_292571 [Trichoderma compactum]